jgi:hypothetical protein
MEKASVDLKRAVETWQESRVAYKKYLDATEVLFQVFAATWCGPRGRGLSEAFDAFRAALVREDEHRHREVIDVSPGQSPD